MHGRGAIPLFVIYCTFTIYTMKYFCTLTSPSILEQRDFHGQSLSFPRVQDGFHPPSKGYPATRATLPAIDDLKRGSITSTKIKPFGLRSGQPIPKSSSFPAQIFRHDTLQGLERHFRLCDHFTNTRITACGSSSCLVRSKSEI
jgi:hypothetical protein